MLRFISSLHSHGGEQKAAWENTAAHTQNGRPPSVDKQGSPDSTDTACGQRPGHDLRALLHEATHGEPEAVTQCVLVLQDMGTRPKTRVWVVPLIRAQPVER